MQTSSAAATGRATPVAALRSTIGLKVLMAASGLALVGFAIVHMLGHLQVFGGRDAYNAYAATLQSMGLIKWGARIGLLLAVVLHVWSGVTISARNSAARPQDYEVRRMQRVTGYGRAMLLTGVVFLAFIIYHLAHFTLGWVHPQYFHGVDSLGRVDIYGNFVRSFAHPLILTTYLLATVAVAMHATHATSSMLRTLGLSQGGARKFCERAGAVVGVALMAGFACVPLACFFGMVKP